MDQYRPSGFSVLPPVVKNLLIINGLFYLGSIALGIKFQINLVRLLGLYFPGSPHFEPYQVLTHIFMHATFQGGQIVFAHILGNMFALWMFGSVLENVWGGKRFLIYYLVTGFGAAALHLGVIGYDVWQATQELAAGGVDPELVRMATGDQLQRLVYQYPKLEETIVDLWQSYNVPTVGASGAVFGVLLAFGVMFPNSYLYLFFAIPIKAKWFVMGYGALELYLAISNNPNDPVAHFAHLGGMLFGWLLIRYWRRQRFQ